jgi:hypothetical protein
MSTSEFTSDQERQLAARGIALEEGWRQLELLRRGVTPLHLLRPATVADGVSQLSPAQESQLEEEGRRIIAAGRLTRFVPASGAASRMFAQFAPLEGGHEDGAGAALQAWNAAATSLPFRPTDGTLGAVRDLLYGSNGLATLPKALVPFHHGARHPRTALEEHLVESALTAGSEPGSARVHFTVPPVAAERFIKTIVRALPAIRRRLGCALEVDLSFQDPSTDTLACDEDGHAVRSADGGLLLRPGGHGSLLRNLTGLNADLLLVRNIDNIAVESRMNLVVRWHRILTAYLVRVQSAAFALTGALSNGPSEPLVELGETLLGSLLRIRSGGGALRERSAFVVRMLDRPWRVCAMVRNEGEPGGGPFWVAGGQGIERLQIVESAQVDTGDDVQRQIFASATHFNPVHLLCGLRDWRGRPFDLDAFADQGHSFVATRTHEGRPIRVLERPGLWNGSMAHWNTLAIEVPAETFAPVKTVLDLLRPAHQLQPRIAA